MGVLGWIWNDNCPKLKIKHTQCSDARSDAFNAAIASITHYTIEW